MAETIKSESQKTIVGALRMFFRAMVGAYGLNILLHVSAYLLFGESWVLVEFFNTFAQLIWLPTLILIPICLALKEWRLVLMMLPGAIAFLLIWGDMLLLTSQVIPEQGDTPLSVLSYNLYAGNSQHEAYIQAIRDRHADVVAIQELHHPQADILAREFAEIYPYMAFHPNSVFGLGILSRFPIVEDEYWQYDDLPASLGHQQVVLEIDNNQTITIFNVHPVNSAISGSLFNPNVRSQEITRLLDVTSQETQPTLFVGDFNMPDFSEDYRAIRTQFSDSFRDAGYGFGWTFSFTPNFVPFLRLDYIFHDENFAAIESYVLPDSYGSDHRGVFTELQLHSVDS